MKLPRPGRAALAGILCAAGGLTALGVASASGPAAKDPLLAAIERSDRTTQWRQTNAVPLRFDAFHPQGMVRVGDFFYISSVEILEPTVRYPKPIDGLDRTAGKGVGHLFKVDLSGNLVTDVILGEGDAYHPGGIDYDGGSLWVPVAEYRPDSRAILYRVDLDTLKVHEVLRADDHIGGAVLDRRDGQLMGVSWGSRRLYRATVTGKVIAQAKNESHFVDYQDCQYVAQGKALCTGVTGLPTPSGQGSYQLGGYALVDTARLTVSHEVPIAIWDPAGNVITRNSTHFEATADGGLRLYAAPADDTHSVVYTYEATP